MKAYLKGFTGSRIQKRIIGGTPICGADLDCTFILDDGRRVECRTRITQTGSSASSNKIIIDVDPVEGLPADAEYDHKMFAEVAAQYFNDRVLKQ